MVRPLNPRAAGTEVLPIPDLAKSPQSTTARGWKVLLFDDDITPFDVVVFALQRAAALSLEVAEMVAFEAQSHGQAVVKSGLSKEDALTICGGLRKWTRIEGICTGVHCEALEDDG
jgi:ATP-dependent Clp protease adapter protein ClpS